MSGVDMSKTIASKSDTQLNSDDLFGGPITAKVLRVSSTGSPDQPVAIDIDCWPKPWKPCKGMRRVLVDCWGDNVNNEYIGRSVRLFRNPEVKWGGIACGGIEISHLSHIDKPRSIPITVSKGKKKPFIVQPLTQSESQPATKKQEDKKPEDKTIDLAVAVAALADKMKVAPDTAAIDACRAEFSKISTLISAEDRAMLVKLAEEAKARVASI